MSTSESNMLYSLIIIYVFITVVSAFQTCECGIPNELSPGRSAHIRVVGGSSYNPHKYPWLVLLHFNGTFHCGGTIVSDQYVLTAAHCFATVGYESAYLKVVVGEHNRCKEDSKTTIFSVTKIIRNPKFDIEDFSGDILLLKLSMKISFNKYVRPICLPPYDITRDAPTRYHGKKGLIAGWGQTNVLIKQPSCIPQQLHLPILSRNVCGEEIANSLFCAGYLEGGKDSCQGDSGGPLQILNGNNRYEIIGIVSNGIGCALPNHPGLYTDATRYLPWIWKNIKDSFFCWQ